MTTVLVLKNAPGGPGEVDILAVIWFAALVAVAGLLAIRFVAGRKRPVRPASAPPPGPRGFEVTLTQKAGRETVRGADPTNARPMTADAAERTQ